MWQKIFSRLKAATLKQKIVTLIAVALVLGTVVAIPILIQRTAEPVDHQQVEQPLEDQTGETSGKPEDATSEGLTEETTAVSANKSEENSGKNNGEGSDNLSTSKPTNKKYKVKFVTDGGTSLKQKTVAEGTKISSFPTPYKEGYIFLGWYYDKEGKQLVGSNDTVQEDLTLYASYAVQAPLETIEQKTFASAQDVGTDFRITVVTEDVTLDAATVLAGIKAENLTDPEQENIINVSGRKGTFTITGNNSFGEGSDLFTESGFAEGSTFRITLKDARLNFKDEPESVRDYNFTTHMEEISNLSFNKDMIYISVEDLSNITNEGEQVETLSIALYTADRDGRIGPAELTEGTFEYTKGKLDVGDVVTVYAGLRPDLRKQDTPENECGDVAYVEITKKNGKLYSYKNAEPEDVIFEPDMLPVSVDEDLDGVSGNHSITVENKRFDYSDDVYANIELDSQTTVDVGDFLMFYTGVFGVETGEDAAELLEVFGKITSVTDNKNGTTTVTYEDAEWEEVRTAMDIYSNQKLSGSEMLENVDKELLETQIEQQAVSSGFAEEAAQYLASLTLATDNFTNLSEHMHLEDYKVTLEDGTPVSPEELQLMDSSIKVSCEMEDDYPKATISIRPKHLGDIEGTNADKQGLSVELEVKAKITITKSGSNNSIVITVSGKFVEEVGLNFGARSKAVWKVWGIFPYIAEYRVTANVDLLNYTGVEVNATMVTKEADDKDDKDDDEGEDIAEMIKGLLESKEEEGEEEDAENTSNQLVKRYSEMLEEESDYLKIVDVNLYETEKYITNEIPIIAINMSVDFIVEMEACVSTGFDFEYLTGKRYTFTIDVFGRKATCDSLVLQEERYEFSFYVMGRLGIRAGIELEFNVGLFSTKLDSVGTEAAVGAYTKLWGYFYYELKYTASQGRSQKYSGAMLVDVGVFMEMGLNAQVLDGRLRKEMTILDKEWSLWGAGAVDNVLDFNTAQKDMPDIKLKQYIRSTVIPDSVFELTYLDLKEGKEKQAVYNDYFDESKGESKNNRRNFVITMTNDKFSYDPQTNTISVHPAEGDKKLEGEMIITWVKYPLSFTSKPIQRTISLYWDNVRDGYVIVPYTNGGTYIPIIEAKYESEVKVPAVPEKQGYNFEGWYSDKELTVPFVFPEKMPAQDMNIYAKWSERTDTPYRVEHYQEQLLSGEYELFETEEFTGTTNSYVTPVVKNYTGYQSPANQEVKVLPDGSAVLRYYYDLEWSTVTFEPGEIGGEPVVYDLKFGGRVSAPHMAARGYTFNGWDKEVIETMGTEDVVYTAQWTKNPDTAYRVEYYVQQTDGSYTLQHLVEEEGYTGGILTADELRNRIVDTEKNLTADAKYALEGAIEFQSMTVKGVSCENAEIDSSGKMVIKINYKRILHKVTFDFGYDDKTVSSDVYYEGDISVPSVTRTAYRFKGWSTDGSTIALPKKTMGTEDVSYIALWDPITYTITFDKDNKAATGVMGDMQLTYDAEQKLTANAFVLEHYTFAGWTTRKGAEVEYEDNASVINLTIKNGAEITLYAVWRPEEYTITYEGCGDAQNVNPVKYTIESETITLLKPVRAGYVFDGWYKTSDFRDSAITEIKKGSSGNKTLYAKWTADTSIPYKVEHYKETLDGSWTLADTDYLTGAVVIAITPSVKTYAGFTAPDAKTIYIAADGSTVVRYDYTRKQCTITLDPGKGYLQEGISNTITAKYGEKITLPIPARGGYGFSGWFNGKEKFTEAVMPAEDVSLIAEYRAGQYQYTVNHYQQNVDGNGYTLFESTVDTAAMDEKVSAVINSYEGFTSPAETHVIVIGTDENANVANYYYTRNRYNLTWNLSGGSAEGYTQGSVYYGAPITVPVPVKTGYSYSWDKTPVTEMPARNLAYTARWTANSYSVMFSLNGGVVTDGTVETKTVTFGDAYGKLATLAKTGYTFDGWYTAEEGGSRITAESTVKTAGNHILYAHFTPITYTITYNGADGTYNTNPTSYSAESGEIVLVPAVKEGYTFRGWYASASLSGDAVTVIPANSAGNKNLYAKWSENTYQIIYHSNNGNDITRGQSFTFTERKELDANTFTKDGYEFVGWATESTATTAMYTDQQIVSRLSAEANGKVHLYAVWKLREYDIIYENMDGVENASDNPTSFNQKNNVIALQDPEGKIGYTFGGWYTDAELTNQVTGAITLNSYRTWTFYAKWIPNPYTITFDSCLGDTVPTETLSMTYDKDANLTLLSEIGTFSNPGYTFKGWSTTKGGTVEYKDGQNVKNLATQGNVTLYAVWELNTFTITYNVGVGTVSHTNPTIYNYEDGDIMLTAPVAKEGYQFLGWYEGDTLVTEIVKGTQKDYHLTAKWAHGGIFYLSFGNSEDAKHDRYIVKRVLPEGTVATSNPQYVYYRTLNQTAYGSTVDYTEENAKYHFKHVGGEDVYLTFGPKDFEKSFDVEVWGSDTKADIAATSGITKKTTRGYSVTLYKIVDTVGGCQGALGDEEKEQYRTLSAYKIFSNYKVTKELYNWHSSLLQQGQIKVTDDGYTNNRRYTIDPTSILSQYMSAADKLYMLKTASAYGFYIKYELREEDDGYQWASFNYGTGYSDVKLAEYHFATKDGKPATSWGRTMTLPSKGAAQGDILFNKGDCYVYNSWPLVDDTVIYALIDTNKSLNFGFDAAGKKSDDWYYRNLYVNLKVCDDRAPRQVGLAPMAFGKYEAGDEIFVTVIYDEVIASASNLEFRTIDGMSLTNVEYIKGVGTNALVFKATVAEGFEVTPDFNYKIISEKPVIGTVEDILGNK